MLNSKISGTLITIVLMILLALSVSAQFQLPHQFYGTAKADGTDLPVGSVVSAKVSGSVKGNITTTESGKYGAATGKKLLVQGDIVGDSTIEFYVMNVKADQTASFDSGEIDNLDLTWQFPDLIELEGPLADEPYTCVPGSDLKITLDSLTIKIECDTAAAGKFKNISVLGKSFLIGAPAPGGVKNISNVYEISVTGDVDLIITMTYDDTGIDESTIKPYKYVGGVWTAVPDADIISRDAAANTITFKIAAGGTPYTSFGSAPVVQEAAAAAGGGAGGGGGGGGCNYDWQCTDWSACSPSGKQTRSCSNKGTCTDNLGKPSEVQDCVYTAPTPTAALGPGPEAPVVEEAPPAEEAPPGALAGITGFVGKAIDFVTNSLAAILVVVAVLLALYAGYYYLYRRKE